MADDIHMSIIYERDLNLYRIDREIYNILDLIGDVGGLYQGISIISIFILGFFNYLTFDNYMVSQLFRKRTE